jgi:hypothetical protein
LQSLRHLILALCVVSAAKLPVGLSQEIVSH